MARISQAIPGLIQGVSELPDELRSAQHGRRQINLYDRLGSGKVSRPPTLHLSETTIGSSPVYTHRIDPRRVLAVSNGSLKVYDENGVEITVHTPEGFGFDYLASGDAPNEIRAVTVGDVTYILNRGWTVDADASSATPAQGHEALVVVKQGAFGATYSIQLDWTGGTFSTSITTPNGTDPTDTATDVITNNLHSALMSISAFTDNFNSFPLGLGQVLHIKKLDGGPFTIKVKDSLAGAGLVAVKGKVETREELPKFGATNMVLEVTGSPDTPYDNHWVKFGPTEDDPDVERWNEVAAPEVNTQFTLSSVPHQLVKNLDGTYTFKRGEYVPRKAGDDTTCPFPSFTGKQLTAIFYYQGRLGLCAGEQVVMSQAGEPWNFFRQTATALLPDDVIDGKAAGSASGDFHTAIEWLGQLWLWSDIAQYVLGGDPVLTPSTFSLTRQTRYENIKSCPPVLSGNRVYFLSENLEALVVNEYRLPASGNSTPEALDLTEHAPSYVRGTPKQAVADERRGFLAILAEDFAGYQTVYVYSYADRGGERVMASWSEWRPPTGATILGMEMNDGLITLWCDREEACFLEQLSLDHESNTKRWEPEALAGGNLDRRVLDTDGDVTVEFNGTVTSWSLPYRHENKVVIASIDDGTVLPVTYVDDNTVSSPGNLTRASVVIGVPYECEFELGTIRYRSRRTGLPRMDGRLQLQKVAINSTGSRLDVVVKNGQRAEQTFSLTRDEPTRERFSVPVFGNTENVTVTLKASGPGFFAVTGVEWEGTFTPPMQRID